MGLVASDHHATLLQKLLLLLLLLLVQREERNPRLPLAEPVLVRAAHLQLVFRPGDRPFSWNSTVGEEEAACVSCVEEPRNPLRL